MGLTWNLSAAIATLAVVLVFGAIFNKAKTKKDSPIYRIVNKFKRKRPEDEMEEQQMYNYKKLTHKGGVKW